MDDVNCSSTESRLIDCPANPLGTHNCHHGLDPDAGVQCVEGGYTCLQGAIRLRGGLGRVEICNYNIWGAVCDLSWDTSDAVVACRQLGLPQSGNLLHINSNWFNS